VALLLALSCFLLIGTGFLPSIFLKQLQISFVDLPEPQWKRQNAIVLLGAGTVKLPIINAINPTVMGYSRIYKAATLYLSCVKNHTCIILISGGDTINAGKSEAMVYREALIKLGINNADIKLEANSMNTYKNAEFTSAILEKSKFDQVVLVTSGIHLRRSLLYFSHFGVKAIPAPSDYLAPQITILPLGYNFAITDFAVHEYLGITRFHIYQFLGFNQSSSTAG
jgi:uncharacterized SAM-binding protein YcdF (DUF218 family)